MPPAAGGRAPLAAGPRPPGPAGPLIHVRGPFRAPPVPRFAAVAAWAVALLARVDTRGSPWTAAGSGLLFEPTRYLSCGLTLFAVIDVIAPAVPGLGRRRVRERPVLLAPSLPNCPSRTVPPASSLPNRSTE
ncbi:hypothetical protein ACWEKM_25345 [Streptomyces sp. NPDC004752]